MPKSLAPSRRWLVLAALMFVTLACEAQWLVHAAVSRPAAAFYAGQNIGLWGGIDSLAVLYMAVFLVAALPASWVLDRFGLGVGVGTGAILTILGSLGKAAFASSFEAQFLFQILLAVAQPFLINAATTLARDWFPGQERATAAGLASLAQYLGFIVAMAVTPALVQGDPGLPGYGQGLDQALVVFGIVGCAGGLAALVLVRRGPLREAVSDRAPFFASLGQLLRSADFRLTLLLFFLGLGILNAVTSLTDTLAASLGILDSDGLLGVGLIAGGVLGAIIVPLLSDWTRRRKLFLILCMFLAVPALASLAWVHGSYPVAFGAMALLGFALMSAGPVGFQYAAETTSPVPEAASQGLLLWVGQVSGIALTAGMSSSGPANLGLWMGAFAVLVGLMALLAFRLKEPELN